MPLSCLITAFGGLHVTGEQQILILLIILKLILNIDVKPIDIKPLISFSFSITYNTVCNKIIL